MSKERISNSILVSKDAYLYLDTISRKQRGCKLLSEDVKAKMLKRVFKSNDLTQLTDNSFGGGDGTYYGKWWAWNVDTLKEMLTEAGFTYQTGEDLHYFNL